MILTQVVCAINESAKRNIIKSNQIFIWEIYEGS